VGSTNSQERFSRLGSTGRSGLGSGATMLFGGMPRQAPQMTQDGDEASRLWGVVLRLARPPHVLLGLLMLAGIVVAAAITTSWHD
jgi:hypothetical protein